MHSKSENGRLNEAQRVFAQGWRGRPVLVARTADVVIAEFNRIVRGRTWMAQREDER